MILSPFFPYYGSCHSMAKLYPRPRFDRLIEPFAGSACYSLHHPERDVVLIERDPVIAELWRYLIRVTPEEVLALPDLEPGQSTDDLEVCPGARQLISQWCGISAGGNKSLSKWALSTQRRKTNPKSGTVHGQLRKSTEVAWFSDERDRPSYRQPGLF